MEATDDIDFTGYWTTDDYEALLGLVAYRYLATRIGDLPEAQWAAKQYDSLLAATSTTLDTTIRRYGLDYLPCSMVQPNTANTCANPEDANWTSPFARWAWDGSLFGATLRRTGHRPARCDLRPRVRTVGRTPPRGHHSVDSRPTTTRAPTTPGRGSPVWPATTTATRGS